MSAPTMTYTTPEALRCQPYYQAYIAAHDGTVPAAGYLYIIWIHARWAAWGAETGRAAIARGEDAKTEVERAAFGAWLSARYPVERVSAEVAP